ncbi:MAG: hypothetical protein ACT4NP_20760 [Pseudonocardiales bacterium]
MSAIPMIMVSARWLSSFAPASNAASQAIAMSSTPPRRRDPAETVLPLFLDGARPR